MNNPFETYPQTFADIYRKRHKCPTIMLYIDDDLEASGEAKLNATKKEHWVNDECASGACEYCHGWQYNEWFQEKPTDEQVRELILKQQIKCDLAKKVKRTKYNELIYGEEKNNAQLITLCIDKDYKQVPKLAEEIISVIIKANYECLRDAQAAIEVFGKSETELNPHIHIVTKKVKSPGAVAQVLRRKLQKDKYQVYRVDVKDMPYQAAYDYVAGNKEGAKLAATQKDKEYRSTHNLKDIYEL
ncbi:MAG: putative replication initiation protein [Cressdnaviricota sp.]|nr:MAG: putative replication initiation protein [Cressdnaviricota sp.]